MKWVTYVICEVVTFTVNFIATFIGLILSIPILGRILGWIWKVILEIIWSIISVPEVTAEIFGLKLLKKLRVCIIILSEGEKPVTTAAGLEPCIQKAKDIYKTEANVKFIVSDIHTLRDSPERALNTHCDAGMVGDDLWLTGTYFENNANIQCFDGDLLRLIGYASQVVIFVVKDVKDKQGCSLGPLIDYVTIEGRDCVCMAHESAHACGLWHIDDSNNLLFHSCGGTKLKKWQWIILRRSRHVTFI